MSLEKIYSHFVLFVFACLCSIPFGLILIFCLTRRFTVEPVRRWIFPGKFFGNEQKSSVNDHRTRNETVWMFARFSTDRRLSKREQRLTAIFLKIYDDFLFVHFPSKRLKSIEAQDRIRFRRVFVFHLNKIHVRFKPFEQNRRSYWSNRTALILSHLNCLASFRIVKSKKSQRTSSLNFVRALNFQWRMDKDELHLFSLTRRSKEEWFYRLSRSIENQRSESSIEIPLEQIDVEFRATLQADRLTASLPIDRLNQDALRLINQLISRCAKNVQENSRVKFYFQRQIQRRLKHLKLPAHIRSVRLSNFHFENVYPQIDRLENFSSNERGLWASMNLTYQGQISLTMTVKINPKPMIFSSIFHKIIGSILIINVQIRRVHGLVLLNIPFPPSDRLWFAFQRMPLIDFELHHRQFSENHDRSTSKNNHLTTDFNQFQTTINQILSRWIEKQFEKEFVLPEMRDIMMKWCSNPFQIDRSISLLVLSSPIRRSHLFCYREADFRENQTCPTTKIYLIGQWKKTNDETVEIHQNPTIQQKRSNVSLRLTENYLVVEYS